MNEKHLTPRGAAKLIYGALEAKQARDVKVLDIHELTTLADFFIIATGTSSAHIATLGDECRRVMKDSGQPPPRAEGAPSSGWVLLDFGSVVLHLFGADARAFYSVERLWQDARIWSGDDL
ncbi:MAG: ribosome silencing factor [Oscillospiraceae bacterium]|nr:ribosome silencing factor [Oscillospiraceae bacterium]